MSILIVEDDSALLRLMERMLRLWGFASVAAASNGQEALAMFESNPPTLIITDLHLPLLDGFALAKMLRQRGDHTPILLLTADSDWNVDEKAHAAGIDQVLKKPIDAQKLLDTIMSLGAQ